MAKRYVPTYEEDREFHESIHTWVMIPRAPRCHRCGGSVSSTWWRNYSISACNSCGSYLWEVE